MLGWFSFREEQTAATDRQNMRKSSTALYAQQGPMHYFIKQQN